MTDVNTRRRSDPAHPPKSVRRFRTEHRFRGSRKLGAMHVGKYQHVGSERIIRWKCWTPACATEKQLEGWWLGGPPGRVLSAGATAEITFRKCLKMLGSDGA